MLRQLRVEYEGAIYHLMSRGDRREAIFLDDKDREQFISMANMELSLIELKAGKSSRGVWRNNAKREMQEKKRCMGKFVEAGDLEQKIFWRD